MELELRRVFLSLLLSCRCNLYCARSLSWRAPSCRATESESSKGRRTCGLIRCAACEPVGGAAVEPWDRASVHPDDGGLAPRKRDGPPPRRPRLPDHSATRPRPVTAMRRSLLPCSFAQLLAQLLALHPRPSFSMPSIQNRTQIGISGMGRIGACSRSLRSARSPRLFTLAEPLAPHRPRRLPCLARARRPRRCAAAVPFARTRPRARRADLRNAVSQS